MGMWFQAVQSVRGDHGRVQEWSRLEPKARCRSNNSRVRHGRKRWMLFLFFAADGFEWVSGRASGCWNCWVFFPVQLLFGTSGVGKLSAGGAGAPFSQCCVSEALCMLPYVDGGCTLSRWLAKHHPKPRFVIAGGLVVGPGAVDGVALGELDFPGGCAKCLGSLDLWVSETEPTFLRPHATDYLTSS